MSNTDSQRLDAMRRQRDGYRNQLRKTEQQIARVREGLEAEALELFRAFQHVRTDGVFVSVPSFASLSEPQQADWLAVARKAREMREEK